MQILALDTETYRGKAVLLSSVRGVYRIKSWVAFYRAILALSREYGTRKFCFYNLDYDVSALLKHLGPQHVEQLYLDKSIRFEDGGYKFAMRYLPGKFWRFSVGERRYSFYDMLPFYQQSLRSAAEKYLGASYQKGELPQSIISNLSPEVYAEHRVQVDAYAIQDAVILQELADRVVAATEAAEIQTDHYYSPGYLAKRWLRGLGIAQRPLPRDVQVIAQKAYYGGRIEIIKRGTFPRAQIYDIRSAYPAAMVEMPNFLTADYRFSGGRIISPWYICRARVTTPKGPVQPLPVRLKGGLLIFPHMREYETVLTSVEADAIVSEGGRVKPLAVCNIYPQEENLLASHIQELYARREGGGFEAQIYKLVLNSLYGIFAEHRRAYKRISRGRAILKTMDALDRVYFDQFVSHVSRFCPHAAEWWAKICDCQVCRQIRIEAWKKGRLRREAPNMLEHDDSFYEVETSPGPVSHVVQAAFTTASVRATMYQFARRVGYRLLGTFTDSLFVEGPPCSGLDRELGEWLGALSHDYDGPLLMLGGGVYETDVACKLRGFDYQGSLRELLSSHPESAIYRIGSNDRLSSARLVRLPYRRFEEYNVIRESSKKLNINFDRKRLWERDFDSGGDALRSVIESTPFSVPMKG